MDRSRQTLWLVHTADDAGPLGASIPTLGHPTSVSDLYRVAALHTTGHEGWNSCYADASGPAALARLIEGPVLSAADLSSAETALQSLMWHERVDILVPAFKARHGEFVMYARQRDPRSELAFEIFRDAAAYDQIFAVESAVISAGTIASSNLSNSNIVGQAYEDAAADYLALSPFQAAALSSVPMHMGVPAYFTDPLLEPFRGKRGFFGEFYAAVAQDWDETINTVPDVSEVVAVPPLVAVILDRARSRADLPAAIRALREELEPVRTELLRFAEMLRGARRQADIENDCADIRRAFSATVKASRLGPAPFLLPLLKLYKAAKSPLDPLIHALGPNPHSSDPRILVERTVTSRAFAELLKVDSMHSLLSAILSPSEIRAIELSSPARK